ncbi:hypothetical protein M3Y96_00299100 [Aphelenchoides besseyi]|nr:hypothetical protein M3Y96_00299100 [Aphelenchoides besseyi]
MSVARFLCVAAILLVHVDVVLGAVEAKYKISGVVKCNGMPYADASIIFMEYDLIRNDECAAVKTNGTGHFYASQFESDGFLCFGCFPDNLNIYVMHKCNTNEVKCMHKELDRYDVWMTDVTSQKIYWIDSIELANGPPNGHWDTNCDSRVLGYFGENYYPKYC